MQYVKEVFFIFLFSLLGEICHAMIPLPLPASIYGLVLLFLALAFRLVKSEQIAHAGSLLPAILPLLFVPPAIGLIDYWDAVAPMILPIVIISVGTTVSTFVISGLTVQMIMKFRNSGKENA